MNLLKMCGPQIRLCLFTFRPMASKQLNSLTTFVPLSWLGGKAPVTPNGDATKFVQRSKTCRRAVGSPRNMPKNIKFARNSVYKTFSQRPYSVHTTFPQRFYSVHDGSTARKQLLQRVNGVLTVRTQRLTAIIAFKIFLLIFFLYFQQPYFANIVIYFYFSK